MAFLKNIGQQLQKEYPNTFDRNKNAAKRAPLSTCANEFKKTLSTLSLYEMDMSFEDIKSEITFLQEISIARLLLRWSFIFLIVTFCMDIVFSSFSATAVSVGTNYVFSYILQLIFLHKFKYQKLNYLNWKQKVLSQKIVDYANELKKFVSTDNDITDNDRISLVNDFDKYIKKH